MIHYHTNYAQMTFFIKTFLSIIEKTEEKFESLLKTDEKYSFLLKKSLLQYFL